MTVCGMGGMLIAEILEKALSDGIITPGMRFVLAPNTQEPALRRFLARRGFEPTSESAVRDGREVYLIVNCVFTGVPFALPDADSYLGFCRSLPPSYYRKLLRRLDRRLAGLRAAANLSPALLSELSLLELVRADVLERLM